MCVQVLSVEYKGQVMRGDLTADGQITHNGEWGSSAGAVGLAVAVAGLLAAIQRCGAVAAA